MKTTLSLLVTALVIGCGSHRSEQSPTAPVNKNGSIESANARAASTSPEPTQPQTEKAELWNTNDELHVADRMLATVKEEGATRIVSVHPSRDKYVFVAEVEGNREGGSAKDSTPKTDLWRVNKNGSGLQRLTYDGASYNPAWSPSGNEIAFVNRRHGLSTLEIMETETGSDTARPISWALCESCEFDELRWAPNGQAVAALENDGTTTWIIVILPDVGEWRFRYYPIQDIHDLDLARGTRAYQWSKDNDLILAYGRFAFDWEKVLSKVNRQKNEASKSESDEAAIAQSGEADIQRAAERAADPVLKSLLRRGQKKGVQRIEEYSPSPSGNRIAFVGGSEDPVTAVLNADLWVVNRNGTGLRRLTTDVAIDKPIWSPSGSEIVIELAAFFRGLIIVDVKTGKQRDLPAAEPFGNSACGWEFIYRTPRWSPNGKAINIGAGPTKESVGWSSSGGVVVVDASSGSLILFGSELAWNDRSELVAEDYGRFVFDWNSALFNRR